jgi:uncharacterized protein YjfI (DUF2170 family)
MLCQLLVLQFLFRLQGKHEEPKKISTFLLLALQMYPASPIGAAKVQHLAYQCWVQLNIKYFANTVGTVSLVTLHLYFQNLPIDWPVLARNERQM